MRTGMVWAALALAAVAARAEGQNQAGGGAQGGAASAPGAGAPAKSPPPVGPTSGAFDQACIDLMNGKMPQGEQAIKTLRDACSSLMSGRANDRVEAERRRQQQIAAQEQLKQQQAAAQKQLQLQAQGVQTAPSAQGGTVQPGQATAPPEQGQGVAAAFGTAASELTGGTPHKGYGLRSNGQPIGYLLVTNPVGWFNGLGINAELWGALEPAPYFSWVAGLRYSGTDTSTGSATTFGAEGGFDWFIIGRNNEGLRVGPRVEFAAGRQHTSSSSSTTFGRMGLGGEVGWNFIARNGISGLAAVGLGGRVAGDSQNENFTSFVGGEFGPYAKVGIGFGW